MLRLPHSMTLLRTELPGWVLSLSLCDGYARAEDAYGFISLNIFALDS